MIPDKADTARQYSFDELTKGLASGTLSRRRALKLMGGALLGGLLVSMPGRVSAQPEPPVVTCTIPPNPENPCFIDTCSGQRGCFCVRTTEGGTVCAHVDRGHLCPDPTNPQTPLICNASADCPSGMVCADVTTPLPGQTEPPGCCPQNVCVIPCRATGGAA